MYKAHKWKKGELITAEKLNNMEEGAVEAVAALENARKEIAQATSDILETIPDDYMQLDASVSALQAANVRYSSRFSNALIGHATGSGSVAVDDSAEATIPALEVAGKSEQVVTTGAQLFDVDDGINAIQHDDDGWITVNIDNTTGTAVKYGRYDVKPSPFLRPQTNYLVVCEIKEASANVTMEVVSDESKGGSQFQNNMIISTNNEYYQKICTTKSDFGNADYMLRTVVPAKGGNKVSFKIRLSVLEDTSITQDTFAYQPFTGGKPSPSPDYPQQISGTGTVTTGAQLFGDTWEMGSIGSNGANINSSTIIRQTNYTEVKEHTQYSFFTDLLYPMYTNFYNSEKAFLSRGLVGKTGTFITPDGAKYLRFRSETSMLDNNALDIKLILNEGDTAKPWEPYTGGQPAPSEEYPQVINVRARGSQLFDPDKLSIRPSTSVIIGDQGRTIQVSGSIARSMARYVIDLEKVTGRKLCVSGIISSKSVEDAVTAIILCVQNADDSWVRKYIRNTGEKVTIYAEIPMNAKQVSLDLNVNDSDTELSAKNTVVFEKVMLSLDTALPWEPYRVPQTIPIQLTAPLHGIGDVRDRIICKEGEWGIERNIGVVDNTQWIMSNSVTGRLGHRFRCMPKGLMIEEHCKVICTKYQQCEYSSYSMEGDYIATDEIGRMHIRTLNPDFETAEEFREFMVDAVTIYPLATPTWEPFPAATQAALNVLSTYPGYTSITVDAGGPAAEISLDYVQDIQAAMEAQRNKIKAEMDEQLAYILSLLPEATQAAMIDKETQKLISESEANV